MPAFSPPPAGRPEAPSPNPPAQRRPAAHQHAAAATSGGGGKGLATQLARARLATARYATSLNTAKADGYQLITHMIPDMGYHYLNPTIQGFDVAKPHILVYQHRGGTWTLGALEWVFPSTPTTPPLPGATYGSFAAACHYTDGTFVFAGIPGPVRQAEPRDRRPVHLLAPGPGDPARVAVAPQPRRPLQRHQPPDPTLQPGIGDPSATKAGTPGPHELGSRPRAPAVRDTGHVPSVGTLASARRPGIAVIVKY